MNERKVVVLGGAGAMARPALGILARRSDVAEVVIADRDHGALQEAVAALADVGPARAAVVDALDPVALRELLGDADLLVNTAGPFFRLGVPVLEAAIDTATDYVDICDDWEPTLDMLQRDGRARSAGVTAVVGIGASPGSSNMLAALAARELDSVEDLHTGWPVDVPFVGDDPEEDAVSHPSAAAVHWMQQLSGTIRLLAGGELVDQTPLRAVALNYPGAGRGTAYTVGHPEPITLARTCSVAGASACVMVVTAGTAAYLMTLQDDIDGGKLSLEGAAAIIATPTARRYTRALVRSARLAGPGALPPFFALATGLRGGVAHTVGARMVASPLGMAKATGVPLALAAGQILDGAVHLPGVHPPDAVLDPGRFFDELAPHCDPPRAAGADVVVVDHAAPVPS